MLISISNPITFVFYDDPQSTNPRNSVTSAEVVAFRTEKCLVEPVLELELAVELAVEPAVEPVLEER